MFKEDLQQSTNYLIKNRKLISKSPRNVRMKAGHSWIEQRRYRMKPTKR